MSGGCVHLVSTVMLLLVFTSTQVAPEPGVDCRQFVFAPKCRGIAAKRGFPPLNVPGYILDTDRKMDGGLAEVLGMYVTPQPIVMPQQSESRGQTGRGHASRDRSWNSASDQQGSKSDFLYDWYLSNKKRSRESDVAYDY